MGNILPCIAIDNTIQDKLHHISNDLSERTDSKYNETNTTIETVDLIPVPI